MTNLSMMKSRSIFVDTSAHFALANIKDIDHEDATKFLEQLLQEHVVLFVSNFIIAETYTLMLRKIGRDKAIDYIENLKKTAEIERISMIDEKRAWEIILKYKDKDFSYTDATSFALMERLELSEAFAFDDHFEQYGLIRFPKK
jgi:predicted nucleic acid-binding protein